MTEELRGSTVIVTGGGRGLGLAIARDLAFHGVNVGLLDVLPEVDETAAGLGHEAGVSAAGVVVDVRDAAAVDAAFQAMQDRLGTADLLVTAAGITIWGDSADVLPADWQSVLDINLNGTFFACQSFARRLLSEGRGGSAALISSMSAQVVNVPQFQASYHASKAAVSMLAKSLAVEWAKSAIRVNAVEPGYMLSDMTRQFMDQNPDLAEQWRAMIPLGRMGVPADLVGLVRFLCSPDSGYITGQSMVIDGGYTAI
ncbi:MAG: SDR family oxidoreductase [Actinobacteria bacterium]|jgi:NAD(P)-dependent dehydrogenase (short-subunit alcohol dehydrogenase family)|nr:SDR family oxidoreductase [Actinomycetota bacterium]